MRKLFKNTLIVTAAIVVPLLSSCQKEEVETIVDNPIIIGASATNTKAMLDADAFKQHGNRAIIYDFVDGNYYFSDLIGPDVEGNTYGFEGVWPFVNGPHQWTLGVHKFFGWLAVDANMTSVDSDNDTPEEFFSEGFDFEESNKTLTIAAKAMTPATPQFDFMYSNIVTSEPQNAPVNLEFRHLFTAVSIGVENSTSSFIRIDDFRIENIPSTRSATVNFNGNVTDVNYSAFTKTTFTRGLDTGKYPYEISPKNLRSNIFDGSTTQQFMMLWPVEAQYLHSTDKTETTEGVVTYPNTWKMYIKYTADSKTYEKRINFPNIPWEAGKKYHLTIVFADKMVELKTEVKPWEYMEQTIDYTNEGITETEGTLVTWNNDVSVVDNDNLTVSIINAQPAQANFTLQTPVGGSWIVSLVGDVNAFEVSPSTGLINGQTSTIYIKPLVASPTRDYKVKLKFTVRNSTGRIMAADNIMQKNGIYTIVLPRNN